MKTFKQLREDLQSAMSKDVGGIPLSKVAKHKEAVKRDAELQRQAMSPPKKPMKMNDPGSSYAKTPGGIVKFSNPQSPVKMATPSEKSEEPVRVPTTAPIKQYQGVTPELKKDGSIKPIQKTIKKEIKAPKPPSVNRQVSTMVGNSKAASIRRAAKPEAAPMQASAKPATKPVQEPVVTMPTVSVTAPREKDPNAPGGPGGFVTGYGSSTGRTANVPARGTYDIPGIKTPGGIKSAQPSTQPDTTSLRWKK